VGGGRKFFCRTSPGAYFCGRPLSVGAGVALPDFAGAYFCLRPGSALLTLACLLFRGTLSPSVSPPAKGL